MVSFLLRRAATLVVTLLVVSVLAFLIPYAGEGDPARKILRARVSDPALDPAQVEALTSELGLDRPLWQQYLDWLGHAVRGDFGYSTPAAPRSQELVVPALGVSMTLALAALLLALVIALPLGTLGGDRPRRQGRQRDHVRLPELGLGAGVLGGAGADAGLRPAPGLAARRGAGTGRPTSCYRRWPWRCGRWATSPR